MKRAALVLVMAQVLVACANATPAPVPAGPARHRPPRVGKYGGAEVHPLPEGHALYQRGVVFTQSASEGDRFTCLGTPQREAECEALRPGVHCVLESPPGYWEGPPLRKGTRVTEVEMNTMMSRLNSLGVPACVCSCDPGFAGAADRVREERERCSRVP